MITRITKYALKNISRNVFLSVSSILVLSLLIFFINILLVIHNISFKLIDSVNSKMTISLYLNEEYNKNSVEVINLINEIKTFSKKIAVQYKTKDEGLEDIRQQDPELVKILERTNPLPETIYLSDIPLQEYAGLNTIIESKMFLLDENNDDSKEDFFANYTSQYQRIGQVITMLHTLQMGLYVIIAIFLLSIAVIVYSIIGNFIYYYRDEIYITRLVGGNNSFIYGPFIVQGVIYTFISFILASTLFFLVIKNINFIFTTSYSFDFLYNSITTFVLQGLIFISLGAGSGFFSSRKYIDMGK